MTRHMEAPADGSSNVSPGSGWALAYRPWPAPPAAGEQAGEAGGEEDKVSHEWTTAACPDGASFTHGFWLSKASASCHHT